MSRRVKHFRQYMKAKPEDTASEISRHSPRMKKEKVQRITNRLHSRKGV